MRARIASLMIAGSAAVLLASLATVTGVRAQDAQPAIMPSGPTRSAIPS